MVFAKKEVIELFNGKKYIVVDTLKENDIWYYYICEVNEEATKMTENYRIITTVMEHGNLFIKSVKGNKFDIIEKTFKEKLEID